MLFCQCLCQLTIQLVFLAADAVCKPVPNLYARARAGMDKRHLSVKKAKMGKLDVLRLNKLAIKEFELKCEKCYVDAVSKRSQ